MKRIDVSDGEVQLAYRDAGTGPPLVLLHGFPFNSELWRPQIAGLSADRRVIAPDLRGFGESRGGLGDYLMADLAADVVALLDALEVERVALGGLSMGGYVAFEFCSRHPERLGALILADTRPEADSPETRRGRAEMADLAREEGAAAIAERLLPRLLAPATLEGPDDRVRDLLRDIIESTSPEAITAALDAMARRADHRETLEHIPVPTLVIVGAEDTITPPDDVRRWAERVPDADVHVLSGAGHVSNLERPDAFNVSVLEFLVGVPEAGGPR